MRHTARILLAAGLLVAVGAPPAAAQGWRFDLGVNGGFAWWSDALADDQLGEAAEDVKFESGWITGAQATMWIPSIFGRESAVGIRANFGYTERPLVLGSFNDLSDDESTDIVDDVNLWSGTGDLMIRFREPEEGRRFLPYIALGAGAKWINPAGGLFEVTDGVRTDAVIEGDPGEEGVIFTVDTPGDEPDRTFILEEDTKFMGLAALGTDIRVARNFGLRLEVGDRIFNAPFSLLQPTGEPGRFRAIEGGEDVGEVIHELYGTLGLHLLLGVEEPEVVAVLPPPPAPPPPPPPAPAPAPPAEEAITVCVIDPTAMGGIREVDAVFRPATGDTLVIVNGQRVALDAATRDVMLATEADWFVAGRPLTLDANGERTEFVSFGTSRIIEAEDLAFLGTVDGVPVYADEDEVQDVMEELREAREAGMDLEDVLEERDDLREDLEDIEILYVPLETTGCVFQPLRRVEEVRKVRG